MTNPGWFERNFGWFVDWLLGYADPTFPRDDAQRLVEVEENVEVFDPIADPADAWDRTDTRLPSVEGSGSKSPLGGRVSSPGPHIGVDGRYHSGPGHPCATCDELESVPYWPVD